MVPGRYTGGLSNRFKNPAMRILILLLPLLLPATGVLAGEPYDGPIIDMHLHAMGADSNGPPPMGMCVPVMAHLPHWDPGSTSWGEVFMRWSKAPSCDKPLWSAPTDKALIEQTVAAMKAHRMVGVLGGRPERVDAWLAVAPERFIPSIGLNVGIPSALSPEEMRPLFETGGYRVLGEIANQYSGIAPNDPAMNPYWALAEVLDVPVAIHLGSGPPGAPFLGFPKMRIAHGSALLLEEVLVKFPKLRLSIMHYGHHRLADTLALMEHYPQVYLDLGGIQWFNHRAYFWGQLKEMIDAGHGKRIMFGSDQMVFPGLIKVSVDVVDEAPFLSDEQKADIFFNNAARFLRLSSEEIARFKTL